MRYLGIIMDENLLWEQHKATICSKTKELTHRLRTACKLTWGVGRDAMKGIYLGAIQPAIAYVSLS